MEQYYKTKMHVLALCASLAFHLIVLGIILQLSLTQQHIIRLQHVQDNDTFIAQKILSSGQVPATVIFQDDAPSGNDLTASPVQDYTQQAQDTEQPAEHKTQPPIDQPLEQAPSDAHQTFAKPIPTPQSSETSSTIPIAEQQISAEKKRRTGNTKQVTMADISRGFIKNIQQEAGFNSASRDAKQLTLQIYATKIWNILKNAFLAGDNGLHLSEDVSAHTQLVVTVDRSGKLTHIHLDYPKQIAALRPVERLIISRAHQAGLLPPLPAQIPGSSKTFSFPLFIEGQKGFHAYSLGYQ